MPSEKPQLGAPDALWSDKNAVCPPALKEDALAGKHVVLGVCGSIAAYKAAFLIRLLRASGAKVSPVLTRGGARFITSLTLSTLAGRPAITDLWSSAEAGEIGHVALAHEADLVVVAPATADALARMAHGRADDPLAALWLSSPAPKILAPAMEDRMWHAQTTQEHLEYLQAAGATLVAPTSGALGSGREGMGRMAEPAVIVGACRRKLTKPTWAGRKVVVTAGPTRERLDPARFLSNPSTGKMGFALAEAAHARGAEVILIAGPTMLPPPDGILCIQVDTTEDMLQACQEHVPSASHWFMAAAPADMRFAHASAQKLSKEDLGFSWAMAANPDILKSIPRPKGARKQIRMGFAAQTGDIVPGARQKIIGKDLDFIVANPIDKPCAGFATDTNQAILLGRDGEMVAWAPMAKSALAQVLLEHLG